MLRAVVTHAREWYGRGEDEELLASFERLAALPAWVAEFDGSHRALAHLKDLTSQLIGRFCGAVTEATRAAYGDGPLTRHAASLVVPPDTASEILVLKGIAVHFLMAPRENSAIHRTQRERLAELVHAIAARGEGALEPHFCRVVARGIGRRRTVQGRGGPGRVAHGQVGVQPAPQVLRLGAAPAVPEPSPAAPGRAWEGGSPRRRRSR